MPYSSAPGSSNKLYSNALSNMIHCDAYGVSKERDSIFDDTRSVNNSCQRFFRGHSYDDDDGYRNSYSHTVVSIRSYDSDTTQVGADSHTMPELHGEHQDSVSQRSECSYVSDVSVDNSRAVDATSISQVNSQDYRIRESADPAERTASIVRNKPSVLKSSVLCCLRPFFSRNSFK